MAAGFLGCMENQIGSSIGQGMAKGVGGKRRIRGMEETVYLGD